MYSQSSPIVICWYHMSLSLQEGWASDFDSTGLQSDTSVSEVCVSYYTQGQALLQDLLQSTLGERDNWTALQMSQK